MISKTEGIVLRLVKYGENGVIATIYTKDFGKQAYIFQTKKSKNKIPQLQPLFILDMEVYHKKNRNVQRIKEYKISPPFTSIPYDIAKTTQALFLAEIISKTIQEEERNPRLFDFITNTILYFDLMDSGTTNFHLYFLAHFAGFAGISPNIDTQVPDGFFDLKKGSIKLIRPIHSMHMDRETTTLFKQLVIVKIEELAGLQISNSQKQILLQKLVEYFQLHFESFKEIKSLDILKEIFN